MASDPQERTGLPGDVEPTAHTLGQALEIGGGYELMHGEAVTVGLMFAGASRAGVERVGAEPSTATATSSPSSGCRRRCPAVRCRRR